MRSGTRVKIVLAAAVQLLFFAEASGMPADTTASTKEAAQDTVRLEERVWTSDQIKTILERETGEPDIEGTTWKRRKNPRVAMLCAVAFPGLGQIYNERPVKAVIAMGVETFYLMNVLHNYKKEKQERDLRDSYDKYVPCGPDNSLQCPNSDWVYHNAWMEEYKARKIDWVWWSSAVILVLMLDAYVDAHLHDMRFKLETTSIDGNAGLAVVIDF
jgi:hypothetical protein